MAAAHGVNKWCIHLSRPSQEAELRTVWEVRSLLLTPIVLFCLSYACKPLCSATTSHHHGKELGIMLMTEAYSC